jgi:hypothetical protein
VISEAKEILDVKDVIASILLVEDLRVQKDWLFFIINYVCRISGDRGQIN